MAPAKITAVAKSADTTSRAAGKHGSDEYAIDTGIVDCCNLVLGNLFPLIDNNLIGIGIDNIFQGNPSQNPIAKRYNYFTAIEQRLGNNAVKGLTIVDSWATSTSLLVK